jgi:hypothetical protein
MVFERDGQQICSIHGVLGDIPRSPLPVPDDPSCLLNVLSVRISENAILECPHCVQVIEKNLCRDCEQHPATLKFSNSAMDMIHGMVTPICRCCYVKRIEKALTDTQASLIAAREDLRKNPCDILQKNFTSEPA